MHVHAFSTFISTGMLNHIQVPLMSQLTAQFMPLHSLTATWQHCSSDIIAASSQLYKKLSDITEHTPETDA